MKKLNILFLTTVDPNNKQSWSGITYYINLAISRYHHTSWIGPLNVPKRFNRLVWLKERLDKILNRKFTIHSKINAYAFGKALKPELKKRKFDFILAAAGESELLACLPPNLPVVYVADSTFSNMVNYYPWHTGLSASALKQGNRVQELAIKKSLHIIFSSEWASDSAKTVYGANAQKLSVLPFGANLETIPDKETVLNKASSEICRLLFVGVDWERKGGNIAYYTLLELIGRGIKAHLTIIGCEPDIPRTEHVTIIPFLNKNHPDQGTIYYETLLNSDFMILPTRADCTPVVFSEAAAFGVPVITTNTGGISSIIKQEITGVMLSLEAKAPDFADAIERIWTDKKIFREMVRNSRSEYDKRLNWEHWVREFNRILERIVPASENSEVFSAP